MSPVDVDVDRHGHLTNLIAGCVLERGELLADVDRADLAPGPSRALVEFMAARQRAGHSIDAAVLTDLPEVRALGPGLVGLLVEGVTIGLGRVGAFAEYMTEARREAGRVGILRSLQNGADPDAITAYVRRMRPELGAGRTRPRSQSVAASKIKMRSVAWLWRGRLAVGKLTVIEGDPDVGKSTVLIDLAARVSIGRPMPDGARGIGEPAGVLILAASEDGAADTIVPRLAAAGADLDRVRIMPMVDAGDGTKRPIALPDDIDLIEIEIADYGVRLIIVDALMGALPENVNAYRDQDVRRALHPLADLAERTGVAVALNRHFVKAAGGKAINIGMGSRAIGAVARCELAVMRDPDEEDPASPRRLLAVVKSNGVPDAEKGSTIFRIVGAEVTTEDGELIESSHIEWQGSDPRRADALLVAAAVGDEERTLRDEVTDTIAELLANGPRPGKDIERELREAGVTSSPETIKRARTALGITRSAGTVYQSGMHGPWFWRMPSNPQEVTPLSGPPDHLRGDHLRKSPENPHGDRDQGGSSSGAGPSGGHTRVRDHLRADEAPDDDRLDEWNRSAGVDQQDDAA